MKIFIICSKRFYKDIPKIKETLEKAGHEVYLPNCYDKPDTELQFKRKSPEEHAEFKAKMFEQSEELIKDMDAVLVLNFRKDNMEGYIGGATFLEMYDAFRAKKKIYLYNDITDGMLSDEIKGFSPIVINGDLTKIKQ